MLRHWACERIATHHWQMLQAARLDIHGELMWSNMPHTINSIDPCCSGEISKWPGVDMMQVSHDGMAIPLCMASCLDLHHLHSCDGTSQMFAEQ